MGRVYSAKTVERAALICAVMPRHGHEGWRNVLRDLGIPEYDTAARLALAASDATYNTCVGFPGCWVEAEALIRSGWMIGDPIELLEPEGFEDVPEDPYDDLQPEDFDEPPRPDPVADAVQAAEARPTPEAAADVDDAISHAGDYGADS